MLHQGDSIRHGDARFSDSAEIVQGYKFQGTLFVLLALVTALPGSVPILQGDYLPDK